MSVWVILFVLSVAGFCAVCFTTVVHKSVMAVRRRRRGGSLISRIRRQHLKVVDLEAYLTDLRRRAVDPRVDESRRAGAALYASVMEKKVEIERTTLSALMEERERKEFEERMEKE